MPWKIEFSRLALKDLDRMDTAPGDRVVRFLFERVATADDPRSLGKALKGAQRAFWRYRVGDWRVLARLEHDRLVVLVVRIAHRREAYR